jgi:ATP-dependent Clp protease ATP-binding subunit ClpB
VLTHRQRALDFDLAELSRSHPNTPAKDRAQAELSAERSSLEDRLDALQQARDKQAEVGGLKAEIRKLKTRREQLQIKVQVAERSNDLTTASDLMYYGIPDVEEQIRRLEQEVEVNEREGGLEGDAVGEKEVRELFVGVDE